MLWELNSKLSVVQDASDYLDRLISDVQTHFGFTACAIYLLSEDSQHLELQAERGLTVAEKAVDHACDVADDFVARVALSGQAAVRKVDGAGQPALSDCHPSWHETGVPLCIRSQVVGVLVARRPRSCGRLERDRLILDSLAHMLASALYASRLVTSCRQRFERAAVLNEIARSLSANLQIDDLLESIYQQVSRVIDTSTYFVALFDRDAELLSLEILIDDGTRFPKRSSVDDGGLAWWVIRHRKPLRLNDLEQDMERLGIQPRVVGHPRPSRAWMGVPMVLGEQLIGVVGVASYEKHAFSGDDEELLSSVAAQAAIAVDNARLYERARTQLEELRATQQQMMSMARLAAAAELASGLGHEVNNALTPILGVTQLALRRNDLDAELRGDLNRVFASASRIRTIVRTFTEMLTGYPSSNQRVSINQVLHEALDLFRSQMEQKSISVDLALDENLPDVIGDGFQLRQVIANVLLNSMDAIHGPGLVRISSRAEPGAVCVEIEDTGSGIEPDVLDKVFEPWFTTKVEAGRARGLGLGLFAAYNVIHAHGGEITLDSTPHVGTSVRVKLPRPGRELEDVASRRRGRQGDA